MCTPSHSLGAPVSDSLENRLAASPHGGSPEDENPLGKRTAPEEIWALAAARRSSDESPGDLIGK
jgi:hypothetical protein